MKRKIYISRASYWNKLVRKFYHLSDKIKESLSSDNVSKQEMNILLGRLKKLYQKLKRLQLKVGVKIAGSALALIMTTATVNAQSFVLADTLRSSEVMAYTIPSIAVANIDGGNGFDIYVGAQYGDLLKLDRKSQLVFSQGEQVLDTADNPIITSGWTTPEFYDWDGDGDLDLFLGDKDKNVFLYENINGKFAFVDTIIQDTIFDEHLANPAIGDFDNDGDLDLIAGRYMKGLIHYQLDTAGNWSFVDTLKANGQRIDGMFLDPTLVDLDGDGDLDLVVSSYGEYLRLFSNDGNGNFSAPIILKNLYAGTGGYLFHNTFADIDNDGDLDLLITDEYYFYYAINNGNNSFGNFKRLYMLSDDALTFANYAIPKLFDFDNDGDDDLFIGGLSDFVVQYENIDGNFIYADTLRDSSGTPIDLARLSSVAFADIDGDNDYDIYVGAKEYGIFRIENLGDGKLAPDGLIEAGGVEINSYFNDLKFADLDKDGDMDLYAANNSYILKYTNNNGEFEAADTLKADGNIIGVYYGTVEFMDIDGDGELDLLTGGYLEPISIYRNLGNETFTLYKVWEDDFGDMPHITAMGDCSADLLIGNHTGIIQHWEYVDNMAPVPDSANLPIIQAECDVTLTPPTATDNCGVQIIGTTSAPLEYNEQGVYQVIWEYTDDAGNSTEQTQVIYINDVTDPEISCIGDTTLLVDASGTYTVSGTLFDATATDNCGVDTLYNDFTSTNTLDGATLQEGVNVIVWIATDKGGNSAYCTSKITVEKETGLQNVEGLSVSVYPNPVADVLHIRNAKGFNVKILDVNGRVIEGVNSIQESDFQIDMSRQPAGMYILQLSNDEMVRNVKIMVK